METIAGFPYRELEFGRDGRSADPQTASRIGDAVTREGVTDLFVFSHGWNNDRTHARELYREFFTVTRRVLDRSLAGTSPGRMGIVGVIWPSILFPDDEPRQVSGGAASLGDDRASADPIAELRKVFPDQAATLDELALLLETQPDDAGALARFQALLAQLAPAVSTDDESGERGVLTGDAEQVFDALSTLAPPDERSDAAGLGDRVRRLWTGAREALRVTTYWSMKERAGHVGERGLGPFVVSIQRRSPGIRIHLIGHSFGARVVSFALKGLDANMTGSASPVKSLTLLQGAFSHFAFASKLPHDPHRAGGLAAMAARVDGPIVVSHSRHDLAVCERYPQASIVTRDDAAAFDELRFRFGAMGANGAQEVGAATRPFAPVGQPYAFQRGKFVNLNGDELITQGQPPSGAHSDIFYEEIAWAVLLASGVVTVVSN